MDMKFRTMAVGAGALICAICSQAAQATQTLKIAGLTESGASYSILVDYDDTWTLVSNGPTAGTMIISHPSTVTVGGVTTLMNVFGVYNNTFLNTVNLSGYTGALTAAWHINFTAPAGALNTSNVVPLATLVNFPIGPNVNGALVYVPGNDQPVTATASIASVPEPSTWAFMLAGFGGIGIALRRRKMAFAR